jgi:hypothetical protein
MQRRIVQRHLAINNPEDNKLEKNKDVISDDPNSKNSNRSATTVASDQDSKTSRT